MKFITMYKLLWSMTLVGLSIGSYASEVSKTVRENFKINSGTQVVVSNSFGKIHINNWDKNEVDVVVEIIAESSSDSRAESLLDRIDVNFSTSGSEVSMKTDMGDLNSRNRDRVEVNYTINMPASNAIEVRNRFGDVYLGDRTGDVDIDVQYGALKAGDIEGKLEMELSFGSASVGDLGRAEIDVKYAEVDLTKGDYFDLRQQFSDLEIEEVREMDLDSKYGSVRIRKIVNLDCDVQFSGFRIGELSGAFDMDAEYVSGFELDLLRSSFSRVDISANFGSYEIGLEEGLSGRIEGEFEYSDLRAAGVDIDFNYRIKDQNRSEYRGNIGTGNADKMISIRSSYGDLRLYD